MRVLVTGAGGQLGLALRDLRQTDLQVEGRTRATFDITDASAVTSVLDEIRPDVIVNAAAYTQVDRAETDREAAFRVNEAGSRLLARAAVSTGIPLIHISTDFVFDGQASRPYRPDDATGPLNVYGQSKLAGENAVLDADPAALIIRTSWLYRLGSRNFVTTIIRLLRERGSVSVVADQFGSPTSATGLAEAIVSAARRKTTGNAPAGIRHFADDGMASRYEFAMAIRDEAVAHGLVEPTTSIAATSTAADAPVRRPPCSALDSDTLSTELCLQKTSWRTALAHAFSGAVRGATGAEVPSRVVLEFGVTWPPAG
jgi:dTDP-4-dehydrorhamnose reductase